MITEDYVSSETAKLLKEKGFKEWCPQCYGLDVRHNGEPIDFDEECELKEVGRENEIEYVDGGRMYDYGCGNFNPGSPYAAPTLAIAMKWLREVHKLYVEVVPNPFDFEHQDIQDGWGCEVTHLSDLSYDGDYEFFQKKYSTYEEACEAAIKYCLENLI